MKDALDAYRNLLKELDKFGSPTFTVGDFNYFYPSAIDEYIGGNYAVFDIHQKSLDDISQIVSLGESLTFSDGFAELPEKYRHILYLETVLEFMNDVNGYKKGDTITETPKRMRTNRKGFASSNAYQRPSYRNAYFQIAKGKIQILSGINIKVVSGKIDYIEIPEKVYLNPDSSSDYGDPSNNTLLQFPNHVNFEIVKHCKKIFLENIESQRYQTSLQEQALRQE